MKKAEKKIRKYDILASNSLSIVICMLIIMVLYEICNPRDDVDLFFGILIPIPIIAMCLFGYFDNKASSYYVCSKCDKKGLRYYKYCSGCGGEVIVK